MRLSKTAVAAAALGVASILGIGGTATAGPITEAGETIGLGLGTPLPPGFYVVDTASYVSIDTKPAETDEIVNIPVIAWSTPWTLLKARVWGYVAAPQVGVGVQGQSYFHSWYNPFVSAGLAWDLGGGFGFSDVVGTYFPVGGTLNNNFYVFNNRAALTYSANGYNLTAHMIYGKAFKDEKTDIQTQADYINLDLTATKTFGKWEVGPVGYGSWDISDATRNQVRPGVNAQQGQFALGGLVGYNFGPVVMQAYMTRDVYQDNIGGDSTRFFFRLVVPLGNI